MQQINVVAKPDFIESVTSSSQPLPAISEIIWNGLDAGAENVSVFLSKNELDTIESISFNNKISIEEFLISNTQFTSEKNLLFNGQQVTIGITDPQIKVVVEE